MGALLLTKYAAYGPRNSAAFYPIFLLACLCLFNDLAEHLKGVKPAYGDAVDQKTRRAIYL